MPYFYSGFWLLWSLAPLPHFYWHAAYTQFLLNRIRSIYHHGIRRSIGLSQYDHDPISIPSPSTMGSFLDMPGPPSIKPLGLARVLSMVIKKLYWPARMLPFNSDRAQLRFFEYRNHFATDNPYSLLPDKHETASVISGQKCSGATTCLSVLTCIFRTAHSWTIIHPCHTFHKPWFVGYFRVLDTFGICMIFVSEKGCL